MRYAGIGSRKAPKDILLLMRKIAQQLEKKNFKLYSGGAIGSDQAFSNAIGSNKRIFLAHECTPEAQAIVKPLIPHWDSMDEYAQKLHGRNAFQVLDLTLDNPVDFIICWTEKGKAIGGTRTAIVLAEKYNVPLFNLGKEDAFYALNDFLLEKYNFTLNR